MEAELAHQKKTRSHRYERTEDSGSGVIFREISPSSYHPLYKGDPLFHGRAGGRRLGGDIEAVHGTSGLVQGHFNARLL